MTNPEPPPPEPSAGRLDGLAYLFPVRVYYEDTDFSGVVYHASYLRFLERGRSEFLRSLGLGHQGMLKAPEPLAWAVSHIAIAFEKPARIEEALIVHSRVHELSGARLTLAQEIWRERERLIHAKVVVCMTTLDGRARRIPAVVRERLQAYRE
jgi:acyl-CoA thioester hydrolase